MDPDAIIPLSGGTIRGTDGVWRSTSYDDSDAFGILGGMARMQAGAILARRFPRALVVANARCMDDRQPSHAQIHAQELEELGVAQERIVLEESSTTTGSQVAETLTLAEERGWNEILFVSNEYHLPRVRAFWERHQSPIAASFVSAESVLMEEDPAFAENYRAVQDTDAYRERIRAETGGIEALKNGSYHEGSVDEKRERTR